MDDLFKMIPREYKESLLGITNKAKEIFKDNLINVTLGGSGGKGKIIDGWSDLDIYIIIHDYIQEEIVEFMKYNNKLNIHIGTTFYTLNEVKYNMIDSKTKVMCFEKQQFNVNPTLYGVNVFNEISYDEIVKNDINNLPNVLHDFRRRYIELISGNKKVDKTYIKKMLVLIKCILNYYRVFSYGYDTSLLALKTVMMNEGIDLTPIYDFDIINSINNIENAKKDIVKFSSFLLDFVEYSYKKKGEEKIWTRELVHVQ